MGDDLVVRGLVSGTRIMLLQLVSAVFWYSVFSSAGITLSENEHRALQYAGATVKRKVEFVCGTLLAPNGTPLPGLPSFVSRLASECSSLRIQLRQ